MYIIQVRLQFTHFNVMLAVLLKIFDIIKVSYKFTFMMSLNYTKKLAFPSRVKIMGVCFFFGFAFLEKEPFQKMYERLKMNSHNICESVSQ